MGTSETGHADARPAASQPTVLLLGPVDLRRGNVSAPIGGAKVRAVLAQLALAGGHIVPGEQLIDGVWGEDPPATATNTLQYHVGVLRKSLAAAGAPDVLATQPPGYSLDLASDITEFAGHRRGADAAAQAGRVVEAAALYAAALGCWRGPALADLLGFPFAAAKAVSLEAQRLACVEAWADAELACGRAADLVPELEGLVTEHPTRERLWEQLMVALYRGGRQADALAAFGRARDLLDAELGVEPSPRLREVQAAVLRQDPSLNPPLRTRPPARMVSAVATRLRSSLPSRLAWLVGADGVRHELGREAVVIGRQSGCDLVLDDAEASRRHARVVPTGDGHAVEDLDSTNGTLVNGSRIGVMTRLAHGDRLEIGESVLRYEASDG